MLCDVAWCCVMLDMSIYLPTSRLVQLDGEWSGGEKSEEGRHIPVIPLMQLVNHATTDADAAHAHAQRRNAGTQESSNAEL